MSHLANIFRPVSSTYYIFSPNFAKLLDLFLISTKCPFSNLAFLCNLVKTILFWALFLSLLFKVILGLDLILPLSVRCSPLLVSADPKNEIKNQNITQLIHTLHWSEMFFSKFRWQQQNYLLSFGTIKCFPSHQFIFWLVFQLLHLHFVFSVCSFGLKWYK